MVPLLRVAFFGITPGTLRGSTNLGIVVGSSVPPGTKAKLFAAHSAPSRPPRMILFLFMCVPPYVFGENPTKSLLLKQASATGHLLFFHIIMLRKYNLTLAIP